MSNVYLHFLLDLWFEKKIKPECRGEAYLVRFADDFVATFQYREDVDRFQTKVRERFAEFGLELAEEKTGAYSSGVSRPSHGSATDREDRRHSSFWASNMFVEWIDRGVLPGSASPASRVVGSS